jgi:uncharacterized protein (DUF983 family)
MSLVCDTKVSGGECGEGKLYLVVRPFVDNRVLCESCIMDWITKSKEEFFIYCIGDDVTNFFS